LFLREDLTQRLISQLKAGRLDAALIALPYDMSGLEWAPVVEDELLAAVPADHALAGLSSISPDALERENLILLEDGHCLREHALSACRLNPPRMGSGEEPFAATSLPTLVQMVASGLGVTFLPGMAVSAGLVSGVNIAIRPIDAENPAREIVVAWRAGSNRRAEGRLLAAVLQDVCEPG
jgi:LysR family hydrogen peroxide-inducible transcriptional activator